jgi:LysM repeat protein
VSNEKVVSTNDKKIDVITDPQINSGITKTLPFGQVKYNDTKAAFVEKGTSFLAIAKQYDIDLSKLFEFNEMGPAEIVEKNQLIYLQRKRKTGNSEYHIVQPGETLHDIAQLEAIRLESLQELNWLKQDQIPAAGEKLNLKIKSSTIPKLAIKENYSIIPGSNLHPSH